MKIIATLLAVLLLTACEPRTVTDIGEDGTRASLVRSNGVGIYISEVELSDGTRCAVVYGIRKGGITCDWD